ncbi:hypothetical protein BLNAU_7206 [Blattamonas nauphoetae]|uniref:Uncharacterized protein n=1 Tax=Blattamonas nauphoetae TaxID=2049346 RepID=A0ABQ9Y1Z5_9EUKA|nr:hypothetical protein BLNAU_7206 [Blattamonas nauphoetae]
MTRRSHLSRMPPTHFCGLSSDVGNALIADADEQILGSPPIVQKWFALFVILLVPESEHQAAFRNRRIKATPNDFLILPRFILQATSSEMEQLVAQLVTTVQQRGHIQKRKEGSSEDEELHHANTPPNELSSQHCLHSLQIAVHSTPNDRMDSTTLSFPQFEVTGFTCVIICCWKEIKLNVGAWTEKLLSKKEHARQERIRCQ